MTRPPRPDGLDPKSYAGRRKNGRPMICVTIDAATLAKLDRICERRGQSRGDVIAWLLEGRR